MRKHLLVSAAAVSIALCGTSLFAQSSSTGASQQSTSTNSTTPATKPSTGTARPAPATVVVLLPAQQAGIQLGNGCWVRFYDGQNYTGSTLTLVGPVDMPKMEVPGSLWRDWDSAVVGPRATVTTFDNENYRDRTSHLNAGAHIADLHASKLGWFDDVQSAKVNCG